MQSAADALAANTIAALRPHAPFDRMDADSLRFLADRVALAYYARESAIVGDVDRNRIARRKAHLGGLVEDFVGRRKRVGRLAARVGDIDRDRGFRHYSCPGSAFSLLWA